MIRAIKIFAALISLISIAAFHAFSEETYQFILTWGSPGSKASQFASPQAVTTDPLGNVYIADTFNNRIQKFDSEGNFVTELDIGRTNDSAGWIYHSGITTDSIGNLYVVVHERMPFITGPVLHFIYKFDPEGTLITRWAIGSTADNSSVGPRGIASGPSGTLYLTDPGNHCIQKYDSNGNHLIQWGSNGGENSQFRFPGGVALDSSGNVYVADSGNQRIQKFDSNGNFITKWDFLPDYNAPNGVAADQAGNVYVVLSQSGPPFVATFPPENPRIEKYDSNGNFITRWGSHGQEDGQFSYPNGVAVDLLGNVYVADTYNHRIQKFSLTLPPLTLKFPWPNDYFNACSLYLPPMFSWDVMETFSGYVVVFSPDRDLRR